MGIKLVEERVQPKYKQNEPTSYQIYDFFEDYFPNEIERHLRELNTTYPVMGLRAQVAAGEITYGQWLLYTTVCFSGQVLNGGLEQFIENCPGLIGDAAAILQDYAKPDFVGAYTAFTRPLLDLIEAHKSLGEDLTSFWKEFEIRLDQTDPDTAKTVDEAAYASDRNTNPENWFNNLESRVLEYVLKNPDEYQRTL